MPMNAPGCIDTDKWFGYSPVDSDRALAMRTINLGTRFFILEEDSLGMAVVPGNEIGWCKGHWNVDGKLDIPFPPEMWFATEMLNDLAECQCKSHGHIGCKYYYPGWSYNTDEQLSLDFDVVRYDCEDGRFWLWVLTGERDEPTNREYGKWKD